MAVVSLTYGTTSLMDHIEMWLATRCFTVYRRASRHTQGTCTSTYPYSYREMTDTLAFILLIAFILFMHFIHGTYEHPL